MASRELDRTERTQQSRDRFGAGSIDAPLSGPVSTTASGATVTRSFAGTLKRGAKVFAGILGTLGAVSIANFLTGGALSQMFGLVPRTSSGAWGILLHPFLHANAAHLAMNSVGIVVIGGSVYLRSSRDFWRVTALAILIGGSATWLVGRSSIHIGASGVVFGYLGYLLTTGWFERKLSSISISVVAAALWGSALLGLSPVQSGISWELHLFGMIGGVVGAWWRNRFPSAK